MDFLSNTQADEALEIVGTFSDTQIGAPTASGPFSAEDQLNDGIVGIYRKDLPDVSEDSR